MTATTPTAPATAQILGQSIASNVTSILGTPVMKTATASPTISLIAQPSAGEVPTTIATRQIVTLPSQMSLAGEELAAVFIFFVLVMIPSPLPYFFFIFFWALF